MSRTATVQQQQHLRQETTAITLTAKAAALRPDEKKLLAQCNDRIDAGLGKCEEGQREIRDALNTVHINLLYREYGTFENYCHEVWGKSPRWARYQLAAASVIRLLEDHNAGIAAELPRYDLPHVAEGNGDGNGDGEGHVSAQGELPVPESEKVLRPLSRLPAAEVPEVWRQAVETAPDHKPTAQFTETVVREHLKPKEVEVELSRLKARGDIFEASRPNLRSPSLKSDGYTPLGSKQVFEHDGSKWTTGSFVLKSWTEPEKNTAECYCLVSEEKYTGRDGDPGSGSLQGYKVVFGLKKYRLGPKTLFKVAAAAAPDPIEAVKTEAPDWLEEAIKRALVFFEADERVTVRKLETNFAQWASFAEWGNEKACLLFDELVDRGLLVNGFLVPNAKEANAKAGSSFSPDENPEDGPSLTAVAKAKKTPEAKPMVLKTAKILYYTGSGAAGIHKKWELTTAENQIAFLAMAQWHLDLIQQLEGLIEKLNKTIGEQSRELTALSRFPEVRAGLAITGKGEKKRSANLRSKIENRKITMAKKAAAAAFRSVPASGGTFLICREVDGSKVKYWAGPNAWTIDPARAKKLSRKKAEERLQKTRKWDSCKGDSLVSMPEAVRRFGKS